MEKRISYKIDNFFLKFKDDIKEHIVKTDKGTGQFNDLLKYIYDYEKLNLDKEDFTKRKRVKNTVPYFERCKALRANGEQCTRRKKTNEDGSSSCDFCGTHMKGTPHGIMSTEDTNDSHVIKSEVFAEEIHGIVYYIDKHQNVYKTEDILNNKQNPEIIGKCSKADNGQYSMPCL